MYSSLREQAIASGAAGLRLYVDQTNLTAQSAYRRLGMVGDHYQLYEDMFTEPEPREDP